MNAIDVSMDERQSTKLVPVGSSPTDGSNSFESLIMTPTL